jgi:hypothetical protein
MARTFRGPDGVAWQVDVRAPGASNAMVVFRHPDPRATVAHRYAWYLHDGPEARSVTARLDPRRLLAQLTDAQLVRLFRRSMLIGGRPVIDGRLVS